MQQQHALRDSAIRWLWLSGLVILLDQLSKFVVTRYLTLFESVNVMPLLDLTLLHNTGAAFSFLADAGGWQRWFFIVLGLVVSAVIVVWLRRLPRRGQGLLAAGLGLITGGALGNVIDRLVFGYVIDFIDVHYGQWHWPAFNIADSAITVGAVLIIWDSLFLAPKREKRRDGESSG